METIILEAFGFSWLVKGGLFIKDKETKMVILTLELVDIPLEKLQLLAQHTIFLSVGIAHAVPIRLLLHELSA